MRFEEALSEADEDGFEFPTATTAQLQTALEALTRHDDEMESQEEVIEEIVEGEFDWEELEDE